VESPIREVTEVTEVINEVPDILDLEERFNLLNVDNETNQTNEENEIDLQQRLNELRQNEVVNENSNNLNDEQFLEIERQFNRLMQLGGNSDSDISIQDIDIQDIDIQDIDIQDIDMQDISINDLDIDSFENILNSLKHNHGCKNVINFCNISKKNFKNCRIPHIRDNIYMPCFTETMIDNVYKLIDNYPGDIDNYYKSPSGKNIDRSNFFEYEIETRGNVENYLTENLDCSNKIKNILFYTMNESLKQIPMFTKNISQISFGFLKYMILITKKSSKTKIIYKSNIIKQRLRGKQIIDILQYQLVKIENYENVFPKYEIYKCFIEYLKLILNYNTNDIIIEYMDINSELGLEPEPEPEY